MTKLYSIFRNPLVRLFFWLFKLVKALFLGSHYFLEVSLLCLNFDESNDLFFRIRVREIETKTYTLEMSFFLNNPYVGSLQTLKYVGFEQCSRRHHLRYKTLSMRMTAETEN